MNYPYWSTRIFLRESPIIFESEEWFEWTLVDADVAINSFMWQNGGHSGPDQWDFAARPLRPPRWLRRWFNGVERSLSWPSQFKGGCLTKKHDYFLCKPWVWANWVDLLSDILWCSVSSKLVLPCFTYISWGRVSACDGMCTNNMVHMGHGLVCSSTIAGATEYPVGNAL